jgi:hypothetical protein
MRAVAFTAFGAAPEVRDIERPEPSEGELLNGENDIRG